MPKGCGGLKARSIGLRVRLILLWKVTTFAPCKNFNLLDYNLFYGIHTVHHAEKRPRPAAGNLRMRADDRLLSRWLLQHRPGRSRPAHRLLHRHGEISRDVGAP